VLCVLACQSGFQASDVRDERPVLAVLCRSWPRSVLVESDANGWLGQMQKGGPDCAITHE
ncbi:hypothetical protein Q6332_28295, partial [Klebsiella pneumoniae]|uniref:hypothetical protein n=1 Tax=Klebsiella pneumoniae TaxID=573 RepID=UPI0027313D76